MTSGWETVAEWTQKCSRRPAPYTASPHLFFRASGAFFERFFTGFDLYFNGLPNVLTVFLKVKNTSKPSKIIEKKTLKTHRNQSKNINKPIKKKQMKNI